VRTRWPTEAEIKALVQEEQARAERQDDEVDPICQCGNPGYACCCEEMAKEIGYWPDGAEYD
jgi:hypothetical protein